MFFLITGIVLMLIFLGMYQVDKTRGFRMPQAYFWAAIVILTSGGACLVAWMISLDSGGC